MGNQRATKVNSEKFERATPFMNLVEQFKLEWKLRNCVYTTFTRKEIKHGMNGKELGDQFL